MNYIIIINNVVYIQKLNRCVNDRGCYNRQFKLIINIYTLYEEC